jgi:hypothetical protein
MTRPLAQEERLILEFLLSKPFPGRDQLLRQLDHVRVTGPSCSCGCDSVGLAVDRNVAPAPVEERVPTDAFGRDPEGNEVGVLLHVVDGYLDDLEFYSTADVARFGRPTLESLRLAVWSDQDAEGTRVLLNPPAHEDGED